MAKKKEQVEHLLIPEHVKLNEKEKKALLEKYNIEVKDLPKILSTDSAISHLDVEEKDVIKIIRKSSTAGTSTFYRGVINE
ncbi:MAG: DNA-directed RNA polymerase subunit H [Nanoarchaeota archaeon]|nr:DNA-directed RNA polymerase subunit H [Nanoarchaeota archaeon]MBU1029744.1 DNA-directed RNA polymerase subunit H [Nanoarchaeota archaeon]MBU1849272.1 DNA-directed RNA polymerase subunit H [Nanoarchaeota archaeon]